MNTVRYYYNCEASQNKLTCGRLEAASDKKKGLNILIYRFLDFPDLCNFPNTFF